MLSVHVGSCGTTGKLYSAVALLSLVTPDSALTKSAANKQAPGHEHAVFRQSIAHVQPV